MAAKYDKTKYEVLSDLPEKFAQVIPGLGIQHFTKSLLTDNDCKALLLAKNPYVKKRAHVSNKEDKPEYKDIGAGQGLE
jgi:hypothetical protein